MPRKRVSIFTWLAPALGASDLLEPGVDRVKLALDAVEVNQHLLKRL